jgi:hypothetical protein
MPDPTVPPPDQEPPAWKRRTVIVAASLTVTAVTALLAFVLGSWGFETRRYGQHLGRLRRLLEQKPTLEQVVQGLEAEASHLIGAPRDPEELARVAAERGGAVAATVREKGRRWPQTRVFLAGDMVYFIFFDERGVMVDFVFVSR